MDGPFPRFRELCGAGYPRRSRAPTLRQTNLAGAVFSQKDSQMSHDAQLIARRPIRTPTHPQGSMVPPPRGAPWWDRAQYRPVQIVTVQSDKESTSATNGCHLVRFACASGSQMVRLAPISANGCRLCHLALGLGQHMSRLAPISANGCHLRHFCRRTVPQPMDAKPSGPSSANDTSRRVVNKRHV